MRTKAVGSASILVLAISACGYSIKTSADYDRTVNFGQFTTFAVMSGNSSGNPLLDQRLVDDVKGALIYKGWREAPEADARAVVVVHAATKTKHSYETFYDGWGGGWRWRRFGFGDGDSTTYVQDYKVGTVVVDIFDAATKMAIWRGVASEALSDNAKQDARTTEVAVPKMFSTFPPTETAQARR